MAKELTPDEKQRLNELEKENLSTADKMNKILEERKGTVTKTTEQLEEQNKKLEGYLENLKKIKVFDDARAQTAEIELEILGNQRQQLQNMLKKKLAIADADEEAVAAIREQLHDSMQQEVAIKATLEVVREINTESAQQVVLSDKTHKLAKKLGIAWKEGLSTQMAINAASKQGMKLLDTGFNKFIGTIKDMIFSVDKATKAFQRQFQFHESYNDMLVQQTRDMNEYGVSVEEVTAAHTALATSMSNFVLLSRQEQKMLTDTAALAQEQGAAFDDLSRGMHASMKFFGESARGADRVSRELLSTAKALGYAPGQLAAQFGSMANQFAKFGDTGVRAFKDVARISRLTGFEMEKVLALANKFDTFEGAAEMTGKLNAALGGNFVNAMDMMMATDPAERFNMIRESLENAGLSFDEMSYYQKQFYADSLGLSDVGDLALMMSGRMDLMSGSSNESAESYVEMQERAQASMNIMEAFQAILQDNADAFIGLAEKLNAITKWLLKNKGVVKGIAVAYGALKLGTMGFTFALGMQQAAAARVSAQMLIIQNQMALGNITKAQATAADLALAQSQNMVGVSGKRASMGLGLLGLAVGALVTYLMIKSPSKLVVAMFGFAASLWAVARGGQGAQPGLMALGKGLWAVAPPLALIAGAIALVIASIGVAAAGFGLMGAGMALMFEVMTVPKTLQLLGIMVAAGIFGYTGAGIAAGIGFGAMALGLGALAFSLKFIATKDLEAIATFSESLASVEVRKIQALTKAIKGVAKAMDDIPTSKALALTMTMKSTAVATNAARALVGAGGGSARVAPAMAAAGGGSSEHTVNIKFDNDMFKNEVIRITDDNRGAAANAQSQGRGSPIRGR